MRGSVGWEAEGGTSKRGGGEGGRGGAGEHRAGVVTFAPGETAKTIVVPIAGDAVHEETETFTVWLSNGDGLTIPDASAVCTIADDDPERTKRRTSRH